MMPETEAPKTRRRQHPNQSRDMILDATERLMRREGYGAVSSRRVATEAGLKQPLVHYYYRTTDDFLLAFYRRSAARSREQLDAALASPKPLRALWTMNSDPQRTALAAEFIALANHRKAIGAEIAAHVTATRALQAAALARAVSAMGTRWISVDPTVASVLLASIGYGLILENQVGVSVGHAETRAFIGHLIDQIEHDPDVPRP